MSLRLLILFISPAYADFSKTWQIASPSVVSVLPTWPGYNKPGFGAPAGTAPEGSGVIVSNNGLIVTASHVVSRATDVIVRDINGNKFNAEIIFDDPLTDLALLKTKINNKSKHDCKDTDAWRMNVFSYKLMKLMSLPEKNFGVMKSE